MGLLVQHQAPTLMQPGAQAQVMLVGDKLHWAQLQQVEQ
jgi:hypothetical protein